MSKSLTFQYLRDINLARANRWHPNGINDWSTNDWLVGFGGEAGEALNAGKKLKRLETNIQQNGNTPQSIEEAKKHILDELADTILYADLVAASLNMSLEEAVIRKFNAISDRENMPEKINL